MPPRQDSSSDSSDSDKDRKPKLPSRDRDFTSQRAGAIESDSSDDEEKLDGMMRLLQKSYARARGGGDGFRC